MNSTSSCIPDNLVFHQPHICVNPQTGNIVNGILASVAFVGIIAISTSLFLRPGKFFWQDKINRVQITGIVENVWMLAAGISMLVEGGWYVGGSFTVPMLISTGIDITAQMWHITAGPLFANSTANSMKEYEEFRKRQTRFVMCCTMIMFCFGVATAITCQWSDPSTFNYLLVAEFFVSLASIEFLIFGAVLYSQRLRNILLTMLSDTNNYNSTATVGVQVKITSALRLLNRFRYLAAITVIGIAFVFGAGPVIFLANGVVPFVYTIIPVAATVVLISDVALLILGFSATRKATMFRITHSKSDSGSVGLAPITERSVNSSSQLRSNTVSAIVYITDMTTLRRWVNRKRNGKIPTGLNTIVSSGGVVSSTVSETHVQHVSGSQ